MKTTTIAGRTWHYSHYLGRSTAEHNESEFGRTGGFIFPVDVAFGKGDHGVDLAPARDQEERRKDRQRQKRQQNLENGNHAGIEIHRAPRLAQPDAQAVVKRQYKTVRWWSYIAAFTIHACVFIF